MRALARYLVVLLISWEHKLFLRESQRHAWHSTANVPYCPAPPPRSPPRPPSLPPPALPPRPSPLPPHPPPGPPPLVIPPRPPPRPPSGPRPPRSPRSPFIPLPLPPLPPLLRPPAPPSLRPPLPRPKSFLRMAQQASVKSFFGRLQHTPSTFSRLHVEENVASDFVKEGGIGRESESGGGGGGRKQGNQWG